jgi:hypothetical protein
MGRIVLGGFAGYRLCGGHILFFLFFYYSFCVVVRFVVDLLCCPCGLFRSITAVIDRFHFLAKDFIFIFLPPPCSLYTWRRFLFTPG